MEYKPFSIFDTECRFNYDTSSTMVAPMNYCNLVEKETIKNKNSPAGPTRTAISKTDAAIQELDPYNSSSSNSITNLKSGLLDTTVQSLFLNNSDSKLDGSDPKTVPLYVKDKIEYIKQAAYAPKNASMITHGFINNQASPQKEKPVEAKLTDSDKKFLSDRKQVSINTIDIKTRQSEFSIDLEKTFYNVNDIKLLAFSCKNVYSTISPYNYIIYISDNLYDSNVDRSINIIGNIGYKSFNSSTSLVNHIVNKLNEDLLPDYYNAYTIQYQGNNNLYKLTSLYPFELKSFSIDSYNFISQGQGGLSNEVFLQIPNLFTIFSTSDYQFIINDKVANIFTQKVINISDHPSESNPWVNINYNVDSIKQKIQDSLNNHIPDSLKPTYSYEVDTLQSQGGEQLLTIKIKNSVNSNIYRMFQIYESNILDNIGIIPMSVPKNEITGNYGVNLTDWVKTMGIFVFDNKLESIYYNSKDNSNIIDWKVNWDSQKTLENPIYSLSKLHFKITNGELNDTLYDSSQYTSFFLKIAISHYHNTDVNLNSGN